MSDQAGKYALDVSTFIDQFEDSFDNTQQERADSEQSRDYYDGYQLTESEQETLRKRGQPIVISNRIAPKIDALLGHEKRLRTDPRAYPRTPKHEQEAESITDAIRFVCDNNRFSKIRSDVAENLFIEGAAAATVSVQMVRDEPEITITQVPWDRFYRDQHSRKRDFSDARFLGTVLWMDESEALEKFKGKEEAIQASYADNVALGDTFDDRPKVAWSDRKRHRIRVLQHWYKHKGQWWTCIFCRGGFLRDPQVSPYVDEDGTPQCGMVAVSAFVDRENRRYGVVKRHISPQDEINKRRSKALHLLNSRPVIAEQGAVEDVEMARREIAKADGYVEVAPGMRFDVVDAPGLVQGQFALLQESKAEIDTSGVNPALEGEGGGSKSGRHQEMLMMAGMAEVATVFEALKDWSWEIYRQVWYRVRQYWTEERWIRVTDDERNMKWVALNKPVTQFEQIMQQAEEAGEQLPPEMIAQMQADPRMQQVVSVQNPIAELDVDIILEDGPDSITVQSEQFEQLVELKKADPAAIPTKMVIEASSLRNKDQILEHLEQGGIPPEIQQQMQEMQEALKEAEAKVQQAEQKAQSSQGDMAIKARELDIKEYEAVTARMVALNPAPPQAPDALSIAG